MHAVVSVPFWNVPTPQASHVVSPAVEAKYPTAHASQALRPGCEPNFPSAHARQSPVTPDASASQFPSGQSEHVVEAVALANWPEEHETHAVCAVAF